MGLRILQSYTITWASPSDRLVSYLGHLLGQGGEAYPSTEVQSMYSTAPADWAKMMSKHRREETSYSKAEKKFTLSSRCFKKNRRFGLIKSQLQFDLKKIPDVNFFTKEWLFSVNFQKVYCDDGITFLLIYHPLENQLFFKHGLLKRQWYMPRSSADPWNYVSIFKRNLTLQYFEYRYT